MSDTDPNKMKVVELRSELSQRGLDQKGNKAALVQRLQEALDKEKTNASEGDEGIEDQSNTSESVEEIVEGKKKMEENTELDLKNDQTESNATDLSKPALIDEETSELQNNEDSETDNKNEESNDEPMDLKTTSTAKEPTEPTEPSETSQSFAESKEESNSESPTQDEKNTNIETPRDLSRDSTEEAENLSRDNQMATDLSLDNAVAMDLQRDMENGAVKDDSTALDQDDQRRGEKRRRSQSPGDRRRNRSRSRSHERKRNRRSRSTTRSPSSPRRRHRTKSRSRSPRDRRYSPIRRSRSKSPPKEEPEEVCDDSLVTLDSYNSDLNLLINKLRYSADPMIEEAFAFMWSGARATYGFLKGKVFFEIKVLKDLDVHHLPEDEENPHGIRVGVSAESASLQLGEDPLSYAYDKTGKSSTNSQFNDFGATFGEGDSVACFMNLNDDPVEISFAKNGELQGVAFSIPREELGETPLFPHVLTKNCSFEVNFGQKEATFASFPENYEDYTIVGNVPMEDRIRAGQGPKTKAECEVIMMCGLPGCGKSTWVAEYAEKNKEKGYTVLGTSAVIDKMKVNGAPRKDNYSGRWESLVEKAGNCVNRLAEAASRFKRNYILDQTNVYASAQRRKMRPFEGFKRRAVVLVPSDEEFKRRVGKQEVRDVADNAVMEMKANFMLPEVGTFFEEVEFAELPETEAAELIETYRKEGRAALPPQEKRFRQNDRGGPRGGRFGPPPVHSRDRDRGRNDDRRGYNSPSRGGYSSPGRGSSGLGAGYGGYRDTRNSGGYNRGQMAPYRGGGMNRGGPGGRNQHSGGRGAPRMNRNFGSYNRDRSYNMQMSKDHKGSGHSGYRGGSSSYGHGSYGQNYGYQSYNYGHGGGGSSDYTAPQSSTNSSYGQSQWKQSAGYGTGSQGYGSGYGGQSSYGQTAQTSNYNQQPATTNQSSQQSQQQSYYNQQQQYYSQQWSQWNQQNQQYYNQYYNQYYSPGGGGYGGYGSQSGGTSGSSSQQK